LPETNGPRSQHAPQAPAPAARTCPDCNRTEADGARFYDGPTTVNVKRCRECYSVFYKASKERSAAKKAEPAAAAEAPAPARPARSRRAAKSAGTPAATEPASA
jgi:hypothetical protein